MAKILLGGRSDAANGNSIVVGQKTGMADVDRDPWLFEPWVETKDGYAILLRSQQRGRMMAFQCAEILKDVLERCSMGGKTERRSYIYLCTPTQAVRVAKLSSALVGREVVVPRQIQDLADREEALHRGRDPRLCAALSGSTGTSDLGSADLVSLAKLTTLKAQLDALPPEHPYWKLYDYQKSGVLAMLGSKGRMLLADEMGLGKAQSLESKVMTPDGWRRMGDLKVGDEISDPDGGVGLVTGVYPQGKKEMFRVFFSDDTSTICCDEHLWLTRSAVEKNRGGQGRVRPLRDFMYDLKRDDNRGWKKSLHFAPVNQAVERNGTSELPLDPYLLGAILGDGNFTNATPRFMKPDDEVIERIKSGLPDGVWMQPGAQEDHWTFTSYYNPGGNPLTLELMSLGLMGLGSTEKFIPEVYQSGAIEERLELLRGLMDTGGDATTSGTCVYNTSSVGLMCGVVELVRGLGGIATISDKIPTYTYKGERRSGSQAYRVNVRLPVNPFHLRRKSERWKMPIMAKAFDRVEPAGVMEAQCIAVSTKRRLYITDDYIVTHNTAQALVCAEVTAHEKILCVAPKSMVYEWACEAARWAPSYKITRLSTKKQAAVHCARMAKGEGEKELAIVSWGLFPLISEELREVPWSGMVLDEDHAAKEMTSSRTRAQLEIGAGLELRLGLSGTPMLNRPVELWPLLHFIDPVTWPSPMEFGQRYGGRMNARGQFRGASRTVELQETLKSFMVRRVKSAVLPDQPGQNIRTIRLQPIPELGDAKEILERMREGEDTSGLTDFGVMRRATGLSKVGDAVDLVTRALAKEESVVVFFTHKAVREAIYGGLIAAGVAKKDIGVIVGSTTAVRRKAIRDQFQAGEIKVILGSEAARDGITLTYGRVTIHVEPWFSPDLDRQAMARVNRIGQTKETWHLFLLREGSTDEHIAQLSEKKRKWIEEVLPGDE